MGSGFSLDAIKVVRANRSLLKRRKFKDIKSLLLETSGKTEVEFKKISPAELARIKARIRKDAKEVAQRETVIYGIAALLLFILSSFFFISLF